MATAALVVIGDEILSGKTADTNTPFLIAELRSLGVALREIVVVADDVTAIAEAVRRVAARSDYVFTSGGVGPTHDDVTMAGVAAAFAVPVVRHPRLAELLQTYYAEKKLRNIVQTGSGVFGNACSRLMVSKGMRDCSTKSSSASAVPGLSVSSPMMMPETTSMP